MKRYLPFVIIILVLVGTIGAAMWLFRSSQQQTTASPAAANPSANIFAGASGANPPHVRSGAGSEDAEGNTASAAPVTIEEFGDFQCPPCGLLYPQLKAAEGQFGSRVRVIFRNFPFVSIHRNAMDAAHAAEAAGLQNHFWEMHDKLYETQSAWSNAIDARSIFIGYARALNLDVERFTRDMDGQIAAARVIQDMRRGESLGVRGTPTVFINNRELPAANMTPEGIRNAINAALNAKS